MGKRNGILKVQVTNTRMDQRGCQGVTMGNNGNTIFWGSRPLAEIWVNLNGVPSLGSFISYHCWGSPCEIWVNLNGVPSFGGQQGISCLKGAGDEYSHGPMRSTVGHQLGRIIHEKWTDGSLIVPDWGQSE